MVVNNWLKRFEAENIKGLQIRAGRGRPPILSQQNSAHLQKATAEIKKRPNSVKTVVAVLEDLDLATRPETLKRFLKKMVAGKDGWKRIGMFSFCPDIRRIYLAETFSRKGKIRMVGTD